MEKIENSSSDSPEIFEFSRSSFTAKKIAPSIKYHERDGGGQGLDRHTASEISGPVQKQPTDFLGALCNNAFQQALIKFLVGSQEDDTNANIIQNFQIYTACGNKCFSIKTENEEMRKVEETSLKCLHEEMDSRVLFHDKLINEPNTIVIRTFDTGILVSLSIFFSITYYRYYTLEHGKTFSSVESIAGIGLTSNNTLRYINVKKVNQSLG